MGRKRSLWSSVATSTISSLLVVAITGIVGSVFTPRLLTTAVPLWSLLAVSGALVAVAFLHWRRLPTRSQRVFLVLSAFDQKYYLAELIRCLHNALEHHGYALELKIPERDYSPAAQRHCLDYVRVHRDDYVGGIIISTIPHDADEVRRDLTKFCEGLDLPVVFADVEPFDSEHHYPDRTAFVGFDAGEVGAAAAAWTADYLTSVQRINPVVLVISGDGQHRRQQVFKERLVAKVPDVRITDDNAGFSRQRAQSVTRRHLKQSRTDPIDVIFCTNDEMAIGAADAVLFADHTNTSTPVIIGVDGTRQALALIEAGRNPLRATVAQDPPLVAETTVDLLRRMARGERVRQRTHLPCEVKARD